MPKRRAYSKSFLTSVKVVRTGTGFARHTRVMKETLPRTPMVVVRGLLAAALAVLVSVVGLQESQAQYRATSEVTATINVISTVRVEVNQALLSFGEVTGGQGIVRVTRESSEAGMFTVHGGPGSSVRIQFDRPAGGALQSVGGEVDVTTEMYGAAVDEPSSATLLRDGDTITLNQDGEYYLYLEGTLDLPEGQQTPPDDYRGTFTLVVTYD